MDWTAIIVVPTVFIGLPWIILHYVTRWKTAATITTDDEALLEELYQLARRLDDRMDTVERLVAADNPEYSPRRLPQTDDIADQKLEQLDRVVNRRTAK